MIATMKHLCLLNANKLKQQLYVQTRTLVSAASALLKPASNSSPVVVVEVKQIVTSKCKLSCYTRSTRNSKAVFKVKTLVTLT